MVTTRPARSIRLDCGSAGAEQPGRGGASRIEAHAGSAGKGEGRPGSFRLQQGTETQVVGGAATAAGSARLCRRRTSVSIGRRTPSGTRRTILFGLDRGMPVH